MNKWMLVTVAAAASWINACSADSTEARCDIYPAGDDRASAMLPCTFSQRQGYVTIYRNDGVTYDLSPVGEDPGNYVDQHGNAAYRQSGMGDQGLIFRMKDESVWVYWSTAGLYPRDEDNATWPFTTADYDATTLLNCRAAGDSEFGNCPAGVLRMEDNQASVTVQNQLGEQFTINFMTDYVNAANREVKAVLKDDTWTVTVNNGEVYEVPLGLIEGG